MNENTKKEPLWVHKRHVSESIFAAIHGHTEPIVCGFLPERGLTFNFGTTNSTFNVYVDNKPIDTEYILKTQINVAEADLIYQVFEAKKTLDSRIKDVQSHIFAAFSQYKDRLPTPPFKDPLTDG